MAALVLELQKDAMDSSVPITELLRKALVVAKKLKILEFEKWITHELNGYADNSDKPEYRKIKGEIRAWNPFHGWKPIYFQDSKVANALSNRACTQSIAEIESLVENHSGDSSYVMPFSSETQQKICELIDFTTQVVLMVPYTSLIRILDAVRNIALNWAMKLEEDGILGQGISFSNEEKEKAQKNPNININTFQGILGNVSNSSVSQDLKMSIQMNDFKSLAEFLKAKDVSKEDISELKKAIDNDPKPESPQRLGERVSDWIGKMISKAASGAWNIGVQAAGTVLANAISAYYGFNS